MEVSPFLGFEELRSDRVRGLVPPESTEYVGRPGFLVQPTRWRDVWPTRGEFESTLALARNRPVALDTRLCWTPRVVPVDSARFQREPRRMVDGPSERAPFSAAEWHGVRGEMCLLREFGSSSKNPDGDRPPPHLRHAVVGCKQHILDDMEAEPHSAGSELDVFRRPQQLRHILHHERSRPGFTEREEVLAPQRPSLESDSGAIERAEALARRTADHDIDFRPRGYILDARREHVIPEVATIRFGGIRVHLDREGGSKSSAVAEAASHSAAACEEVHEGVAREHHQGVRGQTK